MSLWPHSRLKWHDVVEIFELKYPSVEVYSNRPMFEFIPSTFLVYRSTTGRTQFGNKSCIYSVELYPSKAEAFSAIEMWKGLSYLIHEPWQKRCSRLVRDLSDSDLTDSRGHLLNWGTFDYECRHGVGEFAANEIGFGVNFLDTFVLTEDRRRVQKL
jgi:uncharacterized protein YegP (UPF0339 family)